MNRLLQYINETLVSLDIPPFTKSESRKTFSEKREMSNSFSSKTNE